MIYSSLTLLDILRHLDLFVLLLTYFGFLLSFGGLGALDS